MSLPRFFEIFSKTLAEGALLKLTLSKARKTAPEELKNVYLRPVMLKKGPHVAFNYRYQTRDEVKNHTFEEAMQVLQNLLDTAFYNAEMMTPTADFSLQLEDQKPPRLLEKKPSMPAETVTLAHDRDKQRRLDPAAPWLHALGICSTEGKVHANQQDKWRQIDKYLETIEHLLQQHPLQEDARIADMGSGKGYLTFALYDFLTKRQGMKPRITGIELRQHLVDFCNKTARENGFDGLHFVATNIREYHPARLDMLIALHACDTATDLALASGIHEKAAIIVAAPCCHKQVRRDMHTQNEMAPLLQHGILEERQAEILTDGIRALLLEAEGYKTQVFEFISTEHTPKNVMITAVKTAKTPPASRRKAALEKVEALKKGFGLKEHYMESLLNPEKLDFAPGM